MKEAIIHAGPKVEIQDSPIPKPGPRQVVTKIVYSGSNPKDWKVPGIPGMPPVNQGDDISGIVYEVGEEVTEFKKGDRVAAFHEMLQPGGSYAEYGLSWDHTTFFLPNKTTFEEGAAIPLAALTAAVGLFGDDTLRLPQPTSPARDSIPLVVYGGSSAVGSYVIQFAQRANIHPLIVVAGRAQEHVEKMIDRSKGDTIVDYRNGDEAVSQGIKDALKGAKLEHAFDAVSEKNSYQNICKVLEPEGSITLVLPGKEYPEIPKTVRQTITKVGDVHGNKKDLGYVYARLITRGLDEGWFKPQPQEVIPGGLNGVKKGLEQLKDGTASAVKYIFKIDETEGAGQE
ncbi:putative GroES-like superfamily, alcohol dehydrogenase, polyketide synthase, enoylreductase [Septoria linicola]|nr:putative GroES-like superfamily, alcohol dehydrogenase, polyketide synthase, enoylreductase [Septoria linicola]